MKINQTTVLKISLGIAALTVAAAAVPQGEAGILVVNNALNKLVPYATWAFTAGGAIYGGLNIRKVVMGDYRAIAPGGIAMLVATLGATGLFGREALSVLLP